MDMHLVLVYGNNEIVIDYNEENKDNSNPL